MTKKESICLDCKHQDGALLDYEVDTWCKLERTNNCEETYECEYFEEI